MENNENEFGKFTVAELEQLKIKLDSIGTLINNCKNTWIKTLNSGYTKFELTCIINQLNLDYIVLCATCSEIEMFIKYKPLFIETIEDLKEKRNLLE